MTERRAILFGGDLDGQLVYVEGHTLIGPPRMYADGRIEQGDRYLWKIMEDGEIIGVVVDD